MKNNKVIIVLLVIVIILMMGIIGFGGYKYMNLQSDNNKLTDENKTITEELNKQKEATEEAKKDASTNDYSLFVKKMKEEREKFYNTKGNTVSFNETVSGYDHSNSNYSSCYTLNLKKDGTLSFYLCIESSPQEIAKNVLFYRVVELEGKESLFYVTEDGLVYNVDTHKLFQKGMYGKNVNITAFKQKSAKEIVNIIPGGDSNGACPYFVDINGNIYQYETN